jgi:hypothetical protein
MNNRFKPLFICYLLFVICYFPHAWDFGMLLNQNAGYGGIGSEGTFDFSIGVVPRVTGLLGEIGDFIVSGGFELDYNDGWGYVPEVLRTELTFHPGSFAFEIGRMYHSDPLGFIAEGLFDGVKAAYNSGIGTFSAGAWYTGFLYKKRANIALIPEEQEANSAQLDYSNFGETYFAPKRYLGALGWEHLGWIVQTQASILGQFDFSGEKPLNSQYAVVKLTMPVSAFSFNLGGCLELLQNDGELGKAFAAEAGVAFTPPANFKSRLSLLARYSSGGDDDSMFIAFAPFTTKNQGSILGAKLSGLSVITLDYLARLHPALSASLASTYFIRNDSVSYSGYPLPDEGSDESFLGNEFFARLLWSPASDLQINLGGGIFLPFMGNVAPKADNSWRVELGVIFSLF